MNTPRTEFVHISIAAPPSEVLAFLSDVSQWTTWAPWVRSARQLSKREWQLDTEGGPMTLRFRDPGSIGVLDHDVTLASGLTVFNSFRLMVDGDRCELTMIVTQAPNATGDDFARDVNAVRDDFDRIKREAERRFGTSARCPVPRRVRDTNVTTVLEWLSAVNAGDIDRALRYSAPEVTIVGPRGAGHGRELLRQWLTHAGATFTRRAVYAREDAIVVDQHGVWPEGEADTATRFRVADNEVAELQRYDRLDDALSAAGLSARDLIVASRMQFIGYWFRTIDPRQLVDPSWAAGERAALVQYLRDGHELAHCLGFSHCRFECGIPDQEMGSRDFTDGSWVWPEGLAHYVVEHEIMLPNEFLAHARSRLFQMPALEPGFAMDLARNIRDYDLELIVSDELWQRWGHAHCRLL